MDAKDCWTGDQIHQLWEHPQIGTGCGGRGADQHATVMVPLEDAFSGARRRPVLLPAPPRNRPGRAA